MGGRKGGRKGGREVEGVCLQRTCGAGREI